MQVQKYPKNPILTPILKEGNFEKCSVYNPGAIVKDDKVFLFYRAEAKHKNYISRIGLAISKNGFKFERYSKNPIIEEDKKLRIEVKRM